jgi:hypothetical protein
VVRVRRRTWIEYRFIKVDKTLLVLVKEDRVDTRTCQTCQTVIRNRIMIDVLGIYSKGDVNDDEPDDKAICRQRRGGQMIV